MGWRIPCYGISHPAEMPEALWRGMHERFVLPLWDGCLPRRRGSDTLPYWLPQVPAKGMVGHQTVYRPLAGGKIVCTSPSPASTVRAGGRVNERQNRAGSCPHQTTSTLSVRGYAIGRWPRFKPWQGGYCPAGRAGAPQVTGKVRLFEGGTETPDSRRRFLWPSSRKANSSRS